MTKKKGITTLVQRYLHYWKLLRNRWRFECWWNSRSNPMTEECEFSIRKRAYLMSF
jgi:hypothetical protein